MAASPRQEVDLDAGLALLDTVRAEEADDRIYDVRPDVDDAEDARPADAEPTEGYPHQSDTAGARAVDRAGDASILFGV
jgi:hypothetical protein